MSARFENAIAWALSEPDSEKRKLTTSNLSPLIERLGKVVSLDYSGEPDMASMTASDIRYCINRFFPIRIKDSNGTVFQHNIDIVESKDYSDARKFYMRTISKPEGFDKKFRLSSTASAVLCGDTFWILLPESLVQKIIEFMDEAFRCEQFRKALHFEKLNKMQQILFQTACVRLAVETAIHHEFGHIVHGHTSPRCNTFSKFLKIASNMGAVNCRDWTTAKEMAADDYGGASISKLAFEKRFLTFPTESEFDEIGPFAFTNALLLGVCSYFVLQQEDRLEEIKALPEIDHSSGIADLMVGKKPTDPNNTAPPCGDRPPCLRSGSCRTNCLRVGYPSVEARTRFFYMTYCDTRHLVDKKDETGITSFSKLSTMLKGLGLYLKHRYAGDEAALESVHGLFTWASMYDSPDVTFIEVNGMMTLSDADQRALSDSQRASDEANDALEAQLKPMYDLFKKFEPVWDKLNWVKRADYV